MCAATASALATYHYGACMCMHVYVCLSVRVCFQLVVGQHLRVIQILIQFRFFPNLKFRVLQKPPILLPLKYSEVFMKKWNNHSSLKCKEERHKYLLFFTLLPNWGRNSWKFSWDKLKRFWNDQKWKRKKEERNNLTLLNTVLITT